MKPNSICFIECKTLKGRLSEIQKYRIEELAKKGFNVYVSYGMELTQIKPNADFHQHW